MTDSSLVAKRSDITYEVIPMPTRMANTTAKPVLYDFGGRVHINCAPSREEKLYHTVAAEIQFWQLEFVCLLGYSVPSQRIHFARATKENTVPHERKSGNLLRFGVPGMVPEAVPADLGRCSSQSAQVDEWIASPCSRSLETVPARLRQPLAAKLLRCSLKTLTVKIAEVSTLFAPPTGLTRWRSTFPIATLFPKEAALGRFADSNLIDAALAPEVKRKGEMTCFGQYL